jgi:starch phosphorylase
LGAVGGGRLFYTGCFSQRITEDGWQEAHYDRHTFDELPVLPLLDEHNKPIHVAVELPGREVIVRLWQIQVGRVPLILLDANVEDNPIQDRVLTARLYSSDPDLRISQEILLGIGGVRALRKLGCSPVVWHMNEGHSAFMTLERIREYLEAGETFQQAAEKVHASNVFTTHTPVPAGNDEFGLWLIDKYFANYWPKLGLTRDQFIELARHSVSWGETFSMPALALRLSEGRNAVSELHGKVARRMWRHLWPDRALEDVPITHITNGVHTGTWLARRLLNLYDRYLGNDWLQHVDDLDIWELVNTIPDEQLWTVHLHPAQPAHPRRAGSAGCGGWYFAGGCLGRVLSLCATIGRAACPQGP